MKITKSGKRAVTASEAITLTADEKKQLKDMLFNKLESLCEYHDDIVPTEYMDLEELMDCYFYWGDEYNNGYLGYKQPKDKLESYLLQEFKKYTGDVEACGDIKSSKKISANQQAMAHIKAAIDILGNSGMKDDVTKDSIANLATVMFDIKASEDSSK